MTNQYESAIEQSEARIAEIQQGIIRCRKNAKFFRGVWVNLSWCAISAAIAFGVTAALTQWPLIILTFLFLGLAWISSSQAPIAFDDFERLALEYEEMEEKERDFKASLQNSLREWRGY